jgi:hypothetical protein
MLSLVERLEVLKRDLGEQPPRTFVYEDLPFALFRYAPSEEWDLRYQLRLLPPWLDAHGRQAVFVSLADLVWQAIRESEGVEAVVELERESGFVKAQAQVTTYLTSPRWRPLAPLLAEHLRPLDPARHVALLVRAAFLAPALYPLSKLLNEMMARTRVPSVLFYPGTASGETSLQFMGLPEHEALGSYRVKFYV